MRELNVFIGYDSTQHEAYEVCKFSLIRRATIPLIVRPLILSNLQAQLHYWRANDPLASTEFTYSRFLVPFLARASSAEFAMFCDCDILWLDDIAKINYRNVISGDPLKAVHVVKHDYWPKESLKMQNKIQSAYPRKNWSSLMLFNLNHAALHKLTPIVVNSESAKYLHRFEWCADDEIGSLPKEWNWLEGWDDKPLIGTPHAVHFTRGGPWLGGEYEKCAYADLWRAERQQMLGV
jgi:hypothetical protein